MSTVRTMERRLFMRRQNERLGNSPGAVQTAAAGGEWTGIWTGYLVFAGSAVLLLFLVLGFGFSNVNPFDAGSWKSMAGGAAVWSGIAILVATFAGAWAAARSSLSTRMQGAMRGLALWGLVTITALLLAGALVSGAAQVAVGSAQAIAPVAAAAGGGTIASAVTGAGPGAPAGGTGTASGTGNGSTTGRVAQGAANTGSAVAWGGFWLSLLVMLVALAGGAAGARPAAPPARS